jgi:hypothetical protein
VSDESAYEDLQDAEPEDSWDPDDDPREQIANLVRRALLLRRLIAFHTLLDALKDIVELAREEGLEGRDALRADDLEADIIIVRGHL